MSTRLWATRLCVGIPAIVCLTTLTPTLHGQGMPGARASERIVIVNDERLSDQLLMSYERRYRVRIANGAYWYDAMSGAWGVLGGPTRGFIPAGLAIGGHLRSDASRGHTGVFVNGRQLHLIDVMSLQRFTRVLPGRFWVDANGIGGYEGGPAFFNLRQLAAANSRASSGPWSYHSKYFGSVGGDGNFTYFIDGGSSMTSGR